MHFRVLLLLILILTACNNSDDVRDEGGIASAKRSNATIAITQTPTLPPTLESIETSDVADLKLQNIPNDLSGDLYLTVNRGLYRISLDGNAVEQLEQNVFLEDRRGSTIYYSGTNDSGRQAYFSLDIETNDKQELFLVPDGQQARIQSWSPDGQWIIAEFRRARDYYVNPWLEPQNFDILTLVDRQVYRVDGTLVDLPEPPVTDGLAYSQMFLTDSTLLVRAVTTRIGYLDTLYHFDQSSGSARELELSMGEEMDVSGLFNVNATIIWDRIYPPASAVLARYNLAVAPPDDYWSTSYKLTSQPYFIDMQRGPRKANGCRDYFVMYESEDPDHDPVQIATFEAKSISEMFFKQERMSLLRARNCEPTTAPTVELVTIRGFPHETVVETIREFATDVAEWNEGDMPIINYASTENNNYLFWSIIADAGVNVLLTQLDTGETKAVLSIPYEQPVWPDSGTTFYLIGVTAAES
jgi:hypothetical protein